MTPKPALPAPPDELTPAGGAADDGQTGRPDPPMTFVSRFAAACFVVAVPLFIVTTSVRFFAGEVRFYERGFREHDASELTGLPLTELDRAAAELVHYFENDTETLRVLVVDNGEEVSLFNTRETEHMEDVKGVMRAMFRIHEVTLAYVLTYAAGAVLWARERSVRGLAVLALAGVGVGMAAVAAIGVFAAVGFDAAWTRFHEILFRNDLWQLDPDTDRLIQMFPETFWQEATFIVGGLVLAQAVVICLAATACLAFVRPRRLPDTAAIAPGSPPGEPRQAG